MTTKFDIGDDIVFVLTGKVYGYCADKDCDYFKVKVTNKVDDQKEGTWLYLSTNDLNVMQAEILGEEPVPAIISLAAYKKAHGIKEAKDE